MSKKLDLGNIKIPVEAATKTFAILAKRGAGKSYTGAVMAEEFYKAGVPFVVFDPIDVWWGLRFDKNGEDKGLPIVVFGLEHADIPLDRDMGKEVAQAVVSENISCVISTFGMPKKGQRHFMTEFAEELLRITNTPRHVFIEEAHEFVPQRVWGGLTKVYGAVSNLVTMGRNRGLGVTLINQRAATINKDVLTQLDTLLAFRNTAPHDRKALKEWVEHYAVEEDFDEFMDSLPSLPTGEGWLWSPEFMQEFKRIKVRERETFHPDREKLGETFEMPKLEQADIQGFIERFTKDKKEEPESAEKEKKTSKKQKTIPDQSKRVKELEEQLAEVSRDNEKLKEEKDSEIDDLYKRLNKIAKIASLEDNGDEETEAIDKNMDKVEMWANKLRGSASDILRQLAEKHPMKFTRSQIALMVGLTASGGTFSEYMSTLKRNDLIKKDGKLYYANPELLEEVKENE